MEIHALTNSNFNTNFSFFLFLVLNSTLEGNNVTLINNTQSSNASNTKIQKPASERRGCTFVQREQVLLQVLKNKTVCLHGKNCTVRLVIRNTTRTVVSKFNICWDITNKLHPLLFVLGIGAILPNFLVFTTVLRAKNLRRRSPFLLVSEMAFCDLLVGIYSIGMAFGHGHSADEFKTWRKTFCPIFRNLFIVAEVVGSLTSLLMTIERYMAVVFCMRPSLRLGRKAMAISLVLFWIAGATSAALVQIFDTEKTKKPAGQMCLIIRNPNLISTVFISELLLLILVFIYFVVVVLYLHIFIVVRKSARNLGVRRESRLAKRISVIVLTSFVFFAAPNFSLAWFTFWGGGVFDDARFNRTLLWWLPPVCLVTNACLNPCLFAFKNDKFLKALRKKRSCPLGWLLRSKPKVKNDQAYHVFSTIDSAFTTSQRCVPQEVALTMFSAVEEPRKGISNDALGLDISQT